MKTLKMKMTTTKRLRKTTFRMKNTKVSKMTRKMNMTKNVKKREMNVKQISLISQHSFKEEINRFTTVLMTKMKMIQEAQDKLLKLKTWKAYKHLMVLVGNN